MSATGHVKLMAATAGWAVALVSGIILSNMISLVNAAEQVDAPTHMRLAVGSSAIVHLPTPVRDVVVGNPDIVEVVVRTKTAAYLFGRSVGQTNIFFLDTRGQRSLSLHLEVARDPEAVRQLLRRMMPKSRITVDSVADSIVLGGIARDAGEMQRAYDLAKQAVQDPKMVVNAMAIAGKEQVMLKVRVAEVQRSVLKQLGINWEAALSVGNLALGVVSSNPFSLSGTALSDTSYSAGFSSGGDQVNATIKAMERDGLVKVLAEPTLTAISGESARFLAGGEYPVPVGTDDGETQIEFKSYGIGLGFTPVVLSEGRISLKINTEVSELSSENAITLSSSSSSSSTTVPGLKVRRAETVVELPSGGSMVMAGLIHESQKQQIDGTPGLKDIPILGALFRSREYQSSETELAVIVTPYVVKPVSERSLAMPTDRLGIATDGQTILFNRLNKTYGNGSTLPPGKYHGTIGYINE